MDIHLGGGLLLPPVLASRKCSHADKPGGPSALFSFKGELRDGYKFHGPGKFRHGILDARSDLDSVCVTLGQVYVGFRLRMLAIGGSVGQLQFFEVRNYIIGLENDSRSQIQDRAVVRQVTGNFMSGVPHGVAKIITADNSTIIGNFKEGRLHGFYRMWNTGRHNC